MRDVSAAARTERARAARGYLRTLVAAEGGFLPFERFMREALYHPEFGYYARGIGTVGRAGDFSTAATLHGALAASIAAWIVARRALLSGRGSWHVIELGGGSGQMADTILRALGWWARRRLRYHVVERSVTLRAEQGARLQGWPNVRWHEEIASALAEAGGEAIIVSNEFVDAFPCVRLQWDGAGAWREIGVGWSEEDGGLTEALADPGVPPGTKGEFGSSIFAPERTRQLGVGQRVEWHREYARWLHGWSARWDRGAMLTIDYGDTLPGLYQRRPGGTLRSYHRHERGVGPEVYRRFGAQDLTADVNFTDLIDWGNALGFTGAALCTQAEFLGRWLPARDAARHAHDPAYAFLIDPAGAGNAFKALEQRRG